MASITPPSSANPDGSASRLDVVSDERSSQNQGMKRLKIEEMVRLLVGDELVLVVPPANRKVPRPARDARRRIVADFQRVIASTWDADSVGPEDREAFIVSEKWHGEM